MYVYLNEKLIGKLGYASKGKMRMSISFSKWQLTAFNFNPPRVVTNPVRAHLRLGKGGTLHSERKLITYMKETTAMASNVCKGERVAQCHKSIIVWRKRLMSPLKYKLINKIIF